MRATIREVLPCNAASESPAAVSSPNKVVKAASVGATTTRSPDGTVIFVFPAVLISPAKILKSVNNAEEIFGQILVTNWLMVISWGAGVAASVWAANATATAKINDAC
jgi:hypothetical protein